MRSSEIRVESYGRNEFPLQKSIRIHFLKNRYDIRFLAYRVEKIKGEKTTQKISLTCMYIYQPAIDEFAYSRRHLKTVEVRFATTTC